MEHAKNKNLKRYTTTEGNQLDVDLGTVAAIEAFGKYTRLYLPGCKVLIKDVEHAQVLRDFAAV